MTPKRVRELKQISAKLYASVMDSMGTHEYGYVLPGEEETIVLAELIKKMQVDLSSWIILDLAERD